MSKKLRACWIILTVLTSLSTFPGRLRAQVSGTISGFVTDPSGAAIAEATVTATLVQQNVSRTVQSNTEGFYNFPALLPGIYTLTAEKPGFERLVQTEVTLTVGQNVRLDFALKLGAVTQEVTVTGAAPIVDTRSATVSGLVDDRRIVDLPLNGRNVIQLASILPGVLSVVAPQSLQGVTLGPKLDVNGGRPNMNQFVLDGGYLNNPSRNTGFNFPPPDAVQEFRLLTADFSAETGRNSGSDLTVVTKSGTNDFHGSLWEFLRNDALNARNFFSSSVPGIKQNQFGAAAGGPVLRDKLFVFGSFQGLRDRPQAVATESFVPSAANRAGDFSDDLPGTVLTSPIDPVTGEPYTDPSGNPCVVNNIIAPGCISPVAVNLLKYVPQSPSGVVTQLAASPTNDDLYTFRVDWNKSSKHSLFGHLYLDRLTGSTAMDGGTLVGYQATGVITRLVHITLNDTYTFTPTLVNQFTASYFRVWSDETPVGSGGPPPSSVGINLPQYMPGGAIDVAVGSSFELGSGYVSQYRNNTLQFHDALSWMKGKHNFKFGGQIMHIPWVLRFIGAGDLVYSGVRSGDAVADFMLGAYDNFGMDFGLRDDDSIEWSPSFFFQDEYKVTPRFTLTFGMRYEPFFPWVSRHNRIDTVVFGEQSQKVPDAPPGIVFPNDPGVPRGLASSDLHSVAPRLGFAWDVSGNGKTSVRGAYGVFYDTINADSLSQENPPYAGFTTVYDGNISNPFGSLGLANPPVSLSGKFGCVPTSTFPGVNCPLFPLPAFGYFLDRSLRPPYVQVWNLTIQRQLSPNIMLEAGYIGKNGIKLPAFRSFNPARFVTDPITGAPPSLNNVNDRVLFEPGILAPSADVYGSDFRSWYNSFQTQLTKRFSRGFSLTTSYVLAKSIDTDSSWTSTQVGGDPDPLDLRQRRGRSDWDRRHAFVASWLWSPPLRFAQPWQNTVAGGWTFTGIVTAQSGLPLTFTEGTDVAEDGTGGSQHADLTGAPIALSHANRGAMVKEFFNTAAFVPTDLVPPGTYGNAGRGILSGPALSNTDFSVLKDFAVKDRYKIQFRSEFFNFLNQVNFGNPVTNVTSGAFGRIRSASPGRVVQFALKFLW